MLYYEGVYCISEESLNLGGLASIFGRITNDRAGFESPNGL